MPEAPIQTVPLEGERQELEALLASETFRRAPMLARILKYLCERQMEGESFIKEYEIATCAMGRSSDFDPQLDGSVRVNLHHLRKKLKHFYETEGAGHALQVTMPVGQSLPSFVAQEDLLPLDLRPVVELPSEVEPPQRPAAPEADAPTAFSRGPRSWLVWLLAGFALLCLLAVVASQMDLRSHRLPRASGIGHAVLRIACGSRDPLVDADGRLWKVDEYATGGRVFRRPVDLAMKGGPNELYNRGREGEFSYAIPLPRADYEVHLYFAESAVHGEGFRTMSIYINGHRVSYLFDVASNAGGFATPTEQIYTGVQPAPDGKVHIDFKQETGSAFVNGIEILPGDGKRMRTLRQTTLTSPYVDPAGAVWAPDDWYRGGRVGHLADLVPKAALDGFYQNERFGNFTYSLPAVADHTYTLTLYFQDIWFSQPAHSQSRRHFNVSLNGVQLLSGFDILSHAYPGTQRSTIRFEGLKASSQGKLVLSFTPTENYASVNAIMVEDETAGTGPNQVPPPSYSGPAPAVFAP